MLTSRNNLALLLEKIGKHGEAEKLYMDSLEASERSLEIDHISIISILNNLGTFTEKLGKFETAEIFFDEL